MDREGQTGTLSKCRIGPSHSDPCLSLQLRPALGPTLIRMDGDIGNYSPRLYDDDEVGFMPPVASQPSELEDKILGKRPTHKRDQTLTRKVSLSDTSAVEDTVRTRLHRWMLGWAIVEFDLDNGVSTTSSPCSTAASPGGHRLCP